MVWLRSLLFLVVAPGTVAGLLPWWILSGDTSPRVARGAATWLGVPVIALGAAMLLWCFAEFAARGRGTPAPIDPPVHLVVSGPYRVSRNPMYVSVLSIVLGTALLTGSRALLVYAAVVATAFALFVRFYEEPTLGAKFGDEYARYRASVPRWIGWGVYR